MEDAVHDEGDARHVADILQEAEEEEDHDDLRHEAEDGPDAAEDDVEYELVRPALLADAPLFKRGVRDGGDGAEPKAVFGGVRGIGFLD